MKPFASPSGLRLAAVLPLALLLALTSCSTPEPSASAPAPSPAAPTVQTSPMSDDAPVSDEPLPPPSAEPSPIAAQILGGMSLEQKVGQVFFLAFRKDAFGAPVTALTEPARAAVEDFGVGGIVLFSENIRSETQTTDYIGALQALADIPLFIGIDEEGGRVTRTAALDRPAVPSAADIGATGDPTVAETYGAQTAALLNKLGITVDFAPVADVNTNPDNPAIGDRSFGSDAAAVSEMVGAFIDGLHANGVFSAAKHFPGHGDTTVDTHRGLATVPHGLERLRAIELLPFRAAIEHDSEFILVGHIALPAVTGNDGPALFSPLLLDDILRGELGFVGVAITDALDMGAITKSCTPAEAAVGAIRAGMDMLLMPEDFRQAYDAVLEAARAGDIPAERLDEAVLRILTVKLGG